MYKILLITLLLLSCFESRFDLRETIKDLDNQYLYSPYNHCAYYNPGECCFSNKVLVKLEYDSDSKFLTQIKFTGEQRGGESCPDVQSYKVPPIDLTSETALDEVWLIDSANKKADLLLHQQESHDFEGIYCKKFILQLVQDSEKEKKQFLNYYLQPTNCEFTDEKFKNSFFNPLYVPEPETKGETEKKAETETKGETWSKANVNENESTFSTLLKSQNVLIISLSIIIYFVF